MDPSNPVAALLQPPILASLSLLPFVLQFLRAGATHLIPAEWFQAHSGAMAGALNAVAVVGIVVSTGLHLHLTAATIAVQTVAAWIYTEAMFRGVIEPASKSSNPVIPPAKGQGGIAPVEVTVVPASPTNGGSK